MKIQITIDRFEEDKAVLKTEAGDTIVWPKNQLPDNAREGEVFSFLINRDAEAGDEKKEIAKNMLNELLRVEEDGEKT